MKPRQVNVGNALELCLSLHEGQIRNDGSPYAQHPIRVAGIVMQYKESHMKRHLLAAAFLHDVLEDCYMSYIELKEKFGNLVAELVIELTTNPAEKRRMGKAEYLAIKMSKMSSWALVIKLADRLDNISDLENMSEEKRVNKINETYYIIANILLERDDLSETHMSLIREIQKKLNEEVN